MTANKTEHAPTPFLMGQRVYLRPLAADDLPLIRGWANDPEIRALTAEVLPMSEAAAEQFLARVRDDRDRVWFVVALRADHRIIGEAGLLRMFPAWRTTDLSLIIGDSQYWNQGYGAEAILLLLDYAFGFLNFHRVALGVVEFNARALHFYEKIGFRREGVLRDGYFHAHRYHDFVMMSILEGEYRALHLSRSG